MPSMNLPLLLSQHDLHLHPPLPNKPSVRVPVDHLFISQISAPSDQPSNQISAPIYDIKPDFRTPERWINEISLSDLQSSPPATCRNRAGAAYTQAETPPAASFAAMDC